MAPWVSRGHRAKAMLALVISSWMTMADSQGKPPPPQRGSNGTAPKPDATYWS